MGRALVLPSLAQTGMLYVAIGIIGATVMPHNLYLHSALVQSRKLERAEPRSVRRAIRFNTIDATVALMIAFFVNAAILVLAALVFYGKQSVTVAGGQVVTFSPDSDWIRIAFLTLAPLLGTPLASLLFAVALLASGLSSSTVGTMAGQVILEGFLDVKFSIFLRRLITMVPALVVIGMGLDPLKVLVLSQVCLSFTLPFALVPLIFLTRRRELMGEYTNSNFIHTCAWASVVVILSMNGLLLYQTFGGKF